MEPLSIKLTFCMCTKFKTLVNRIITFTNIPMQKAYEKINLQVEGMTCANCALGITKLLEQKGQQGVYVNFATGEVQFNKSANQEVEKLVSGIEGLGYKVVSEQAQASANTSRWTPTEKRFLITLPFTVLLLMAMIPGLAILHNPQIQLLLCLPVYLIGVYHFGKSAWGSIKSGVMNMDVLIFVGTTAAFGYSLYGYIQNAGMQYMFFETAASIVTLVLLGNVIEHRSVKQTTTAIAALKKLQPQFAKRVLFDLLTGADNIDEIPAAELVKNDVILVNTGDQIPADGIVLSGNAYIDEAMLTGESVAVFKQKGDVVSGGTINTNGIIKCKVTATAGHTSLDAIIELVKQAQTEKPPVQRLADKISAIFVPVVLILALITFFGAWILFNINIQTSLLNSIAVLVIACPCAMGLATPTAIMVGLGRLAKNGILIKGATTAEQFAKTKVIVFDKTGTLTTGEFIVENLQIFNEDVETISGIIHTMEQHSSHPIAISLVKHFNTNNKIALPDIIEIKGRGMQAKDALGNIYFLEAELNSNFDLKLTKNNQLIAGFNISDAIKPHAAATIQYFINNGITPVLLSGDKTNKVESVANSLGIKTYYSERKPDEKLAIIKTLKSKGIVAMVGDGINDSPALETADIGISMSNATQIAISSAQIILLNGQLDKLMVGHQLSVQTLKTIRQNLFWAFFYNVIAIPIAAVGLLSPIIAALSMAFSDVFVIGNSILLKTKKLSSKW